MVFFFFDPDPDLSETELFTALLLLAFVVEDKNKAHCYLDLVLKI